MTNKKNNTESHSSVDKLQQISPNISKIVTKNWNILQISHNLKKIFVKKPMITHKRNKNLGERIRVYTLQGGKVFKTHFQLIKGEHQNHAMQQTNK